MRPRSLAASAGRCRRVQTARSAAPATAYRACLASLVMGVAMLGLLLSVVAERAVDVDQDLLLPLGQVGVLEDADLQVGRLLLVEDPGPHVQRLGADPQRLGDVLEDPGRRLAKPPLDLGKVGVRHPRLAGQLAQGQLRLAPLLADVATDVAELVHPRRHDPSTLLTLARVVAVYNFCKHPPPFTGGPPRRSPGPPRFTGGPPRRSPGPPRGVDPPERERPPQGERAVLGGQQVDE